MSFKIIILVYTMHLCRQDKIDRYRLLCLATDIVKTEEFTKECIIAKQFDHPNVLGLIGVSIIKKEALPLMILPYMHNGDVKSFVKSKRGASIKVTDFPIVSVRVIGILRQCGHCKA